MAIEWMESWGHYRDFTDMEARYRLDGGGAANGTNFVILPTGGPTTFPGSNRARSPNGGAVSFLGKVGQSQSLAFEFDVAQEVEYIVGFNMFFEGFESESISETGRETFLYLRDKTGGATQVSLEFQPEGSTAFPETTGYLFLKLSTNSIFYNGEQEALDLGDPTFHQINYGRWYYIELRILVGNAGVGESELRVDGDVWNKQLGRDTQVTGNQWINEIWIANGETNGSGTTGSGLIFKIADFHAVSVQGGGNETGFQFPAVIDKLYPNAEVVGEIDFTPETGTDNSAMVDDNPQHDFDSTNNEANVATNKDRLLTGGSVPLSTAGRVHAVQVLAMMKDTLDTAARTVRTVVFENLTEAVGPTQTLSESEWQSVYAIFEDNPDTSAAWLMADVEAAEIGYEIVS